MILDIDIVLDWQQRGMNARTLGFSSEDCPQKRGIDHSGDPHALAKTDAWNFGWAIEHAARTSQAAVAKRWSSEG
jgi:hypothetical protein